SRNVMAILDRVFSWQNLTACSTTKLQTDYPMRSNSIKDFQSLSVWCRNIRLQGRVKKTCHAVVILEPMHSKPRGSITIMIGLSRRQRNCGDYPQKADIS